MEGYMQSQARARLHELRAQFEAVVDVIQTRKQHQLHEKNHPGRMATLLSNSERCLQEADWILPALAEGNPAQKIGFIGFCNTLRLADQAMLLALIDPDVKAGEARRADRQAGAAAVNAERRAPHAGIIAVLARRMDELGDPEKPGELWPELYAKLDSANLNPKDRGDRYNFDGGSITRENFSKALRRARKNGQR